MLSSAAPTTKPSVSDSCLSYLAPQVTVDWSAIDSVSKPGTPEDKRSRKGKGGCVTLRNTLLPGSKPSRDELSSDPKLPVRIASGIDVPPEKFAVPAPVVPFAVILAGIVITVLPASPAAS